MPTSTLRKKLFLGSLTCFGLTHFCVVFHILQTVADSYIMQVNDGPSSHPIFVAPVNGNPQRSSGYVPGRIVPVRSPPPTKAPPPPPLKAQATPPARPSVFNLSEDENRRERAQNRQRKNTYICVGVFFGLFLLVLILVLSLTSKDVLDGKTQFDVCPLAPSDPYLNLCTDVVDGDERSNLTKSFSFHTVCFLALNLHISSFCRKLPPSQSCTAVLEARS